MESTQPARGMRDFLPADVRKRNYVINIIKEVYESYGFEPLETPSVENLETLMGKYGDEGNQLVFKILKRGEKLDLEHATKESDLSDLALRYDLTVPLARVVANYRNDLPKFFKRYQIQPVWRADRPAKGRFREFYQCDVDVIGSKSMIVEAELICAVSEILTKLGFGNFLVRINHRAVLSALMDAAGVVTSLHEAALTSLDKIDKIGRKGVDEELQNRGISQNASSVILDLFETFTNESSELENLTQGSIKLHDNVLEKKGVRYTSNLHALERLQEFFGNNIEGKAAIDELHQILRLTEELGKDSHIRIDPSLARGLSYYTGTIMEINVPDLAGSLGGGGRYDGLIGMFGKEQIPACGFSLGLERILVVMDERRMFPPEIAESKSADVMVTIPEGKNSQKGVHEALSIARKLREQGLRVLMYPRPDKLKNQVRYADSLGIKEIFILGDDRQKTGLVNVRDMVLRVQKMVSPPEEEVKRSNWELNVFREFAVLSNLELDLDKIASENYPKPDISCVIGKSRTYFEIKLVTQERSLFKTLRHAIKQLYFAHDAETGILICYDNKKRLKSGATQKLEAFTINESSSTFGSVWIYERSHKVVHKVWSRISNY